MVVFRPQTSMSNTPPTDADPWDRPLDVSGKLNVTFSDAYTASRTAVENPSPHVIKLLHFQAPSPTTGMTQRPRGRKIAREYGTTRAISLRSFYPPSHTELLLGRNKHVPMPQLVVTSPRTGSVSSVVPPASAFQPPIRILKRSAVPTQTSAGDGSPTSATSGTFAERSARYNAARERIFAGTTEPSVSTREDGAVSTVIRNPKGPEHAQGLNGPGREGSHGFGSRAGKRGDSSRPNEMQGRQLQGTDLGPEIGPFSN
jgi:hypothetical protein